MDSGGAEERTTFEAGIELDILAARKRWRAAGVSPAAMDEREARLRRESLELVDDPPGDPVVLIERAMDRALEMGFPPEEVEAMRVRLLAGVAEMARTGKRRVRIAGPERCAS